MSDKAQDAPLSKSGSWIGISLFLVAGIGGAVLFYLRTYEHYREAKGVTEITISGGRFAVTDYQGLFHESWPQRLRGCFTLKDPAGAVAAGRPAGSAAPYAAPPWFECWDAAALDQALKDGRANAVIAETNDRGGFVQERIVAVYPDGRAFQWVRQRDRGR